MCSIVVLVSAYDPLLLAGEEKWRCFERGGGGTIVGKIGLRGRGVVGWTG